jgi:hypothetical protein
MITSISARHLDTLTSLHLQAALNRFDLGRLLSATPIAWGNWGQNDWLNSSSGQWLPFRHRSAPKGHVSCVRVDARRANPDAALEIVNGDRTAVLSGRRMLTGQVSVPTSMPTMCWMGRRRGQWDWNR